MKKLLLLSAFVILLGSVQANNNPFYELKKYHKVHIKKSKKEPFAPKVKKHRYSLCKRIQIAIMKRR